MLLGFRDKESAERFKAFGTKYTEGGDIPWDEYWVFKNEPVVECDILPAKARKTLKVELLDAMISVITGRTKRISVTRTAGKSEETTGIKFDFECKSQ